jgi:3-hydroxymyristoyl/3-hydroxydecanoyl-(acyl carrier protein) dehydratase
MALSRSPNLIDIESTFLPLAQMRQISRVTELSGAAICGEVDLGAEHWVYPQHFPGDPIFPGTLMIEAAGQLVALWAWANGSRGRPRLVRVHAEFRGPVCRAESHLALRGEVRQKRNLCFGKVSVQAAMGEVAHVAAVLALLPAAPEADGAGGPPPVPAR